MPYAQQMISVPVAAIFRRFGIHAWIHVDDLIAAHVDQCYLFVVCAYVTHSLSLSGIKMNREKTCVVPHREVEFVGTTWTQAGIRRFYHFKLIYRGTTEDLSLKQVQMAAGYLNYYCSFAKTSYQFVTYFLRHWESIKNDQGIFNFWFIFFLLILYFLTLIRPL